ncbi:MAG TPA: hypothetical protein VFC61_05020 [Blastocatellia bacterium]|nr:hypothetical protein [Blastocatellia bacterium]
MKSKEAATAGRSGLPTWQRLLLGGAALLAAFLLGYVPGALEARAARRLEPRLQLAQSLGQLGMVSYEANRNNFANAAQVSTGFFEDLRGLAGRTEDAKLTAQLQALLARRDEVTTNLAQADPAVKEKVAQMYADLYQIVTAQ